MIYRPVELSPKNNSIDATKIQNFSARINGSMCTNYQIVIKDNDTDKILYDSGKIHLEVPLYNKQLLVHKLTNNILSNGYNCKWILTVWENDINVSSGEVFFMTYDTPKVSLIVPETINSQKYTPKAIYTQLQGISIKYFYYILYDEFDNILQQTENIMSANLSYDFDGFLNNKIYKLECFVCDQNDMKNSSGKQIFNISYSQPNIVLIPNTEVIQNKGAVKIKIGKAIRLDGKSEGNISYKNNFIIGGNKGLSLNNSDVENTNLTINRNNSIINPISCINYLGNNIVPINNLAQHGQELPIGINQQLEIQISNKYIYKVPNDISRLTFNVNIPLEFTKIFKIQFSIGFIGVFCSLGDDEYLVGYDGQRFYFNNKKSIFYSRPIELPTEPVYIVVRPTDVFINGIRLGF